MHSLCWLDASCWRVACSLSGRRLDVQRRWYLVWGKACCFKKKKKKRYFYIYVWTSRMSSSWINTFSCGFTSQLVLGSLEVDWLNCQTTASVLCDYYSVDGALLVSGRCFLCVRYFQVMNILQYYYKSKFFYNNICYYLHLTKNKVTVMQFLLLFCYVLLFSNKLANSTTLLLTLPLPEFPPHLCPESCSDPDPLLGCSWV